MANSAIQSAQFGVATETQRGVANGTDLRNLVFGGSALAFRNKIINGKMEIDQRYSGTAFTPTTSGSYVTDRWNCGITQASKFKVEQSSVAPAGFSKSMLITSLATTAVGASDTFFVQQYVEGFNSADLDFGKSSAKTITLSFWVRSSLTGTFSVFVGNGLANYGYPTTYSISAANTWEYKTITIPGAIAGTWEGATNGKGLRLVFSLGTGANYAGTANTWQTAGVVTNEIYAATGATSLVGTNGATLYITGVQLEAGSVATPFENRPYGMELQLCQRYCEIVPDVAAVRLIAPSSYSNSQHILFKVTKRGTVTTTIYGTTGYPNNAGNYDRDGLGNTAASAVSNTNGFYVNISAGSSGLCAYKAEAEL